jgi:dihydroorotate dehydrogenase electron transfer subunit
MIQEKQTILRNTEIAPNIYELVMQSDKACEMRPGQFVHIQVPREDLLLRRPISIAKIDGENSAYTLLIRADGEGTRSICARKAGQTLDILGPLGNGFDTDFLTQEDKVLLIGGGIGVPPLLGLAEALKVKQADIQIILGKAPSSMKKRSET